MALRPLDREVDALILLRALFDHAVTFAWLAGDPGKNRHQRFLKSDLCDRLRIDDDCRTIRSGGTAIEVIDDERRLNFERGMRVSAANPMG